MNHILPLSRLFIAVYIYGFLLLILFKPFEAFAQVEGVEIGERVRITAPTVQPGKIKGTVASFTASTMTLSLRDTTLLIPYASIQKAEVMNGRKRNIGKGALIGAASGAVALGIVSAATNKPCGDGDWCFFEMSNAEAFGFGALIGALGGAVNGAIIGTFIKTDRWEEVPVRISVAVIPSSGDYHTVGPKLVFRF